MEGLEKERDFYFSKLRDVEILCQQHESDGVPVIKQILDILYATEVYYLFVRLYWILLKTVTKTYFQLKSKSFNTKS